MHQNKDNSSEEKKATDSQDNAPSRRANRKSYRYTKLIVTVVGIVIVLLFISPIIAYMHNQNNFNRPQTDAQIASSKAKSRASSRAIVEKNAKTQASSANASRSKAKKASSLAAAKSSSLAATSSKTSTSSADSSSKTSSSSSSQSSQTEKKYVTVPAGEGLYRIAVNNGITQQKLMELNGLTSSSELKPGQRLRVK